MKTFVMLTLVLLVVTLTQAQTYQMLYEFQGKTGGYFPSTLILDASDNLYGAIAGGTNSDGFVFKISPTGQETVLLTGNANKSYPARLRNIHRRIK